MLSEPALFPLAPSQKDSLAVQSVVSLYAQSKFGGVANLTGRNGWSFKHKHKDV